MTLSTVEVLDLVVQAKGPFVAKAANGDEIKYDGRGGYSCQFELGYAETDQEFLVEFKEEEEPKGY